MDILIFTFAKIFSHLILLPWPLTPELDSKFSSNQNSSTLSSFSPEMSHRWLIWMGDDESSEEEDWQGVIICVLAFCEQICLIKIDKCVSFQYLKSFQWFWIIIKITVTTVENYFCNTTVMADKTLWAFNNLQWPYCNYCPLLITYWSLGSGK